MLKMAFLVQNLLIIGVCVCICLYACIALSHLKHMFEINCPKNWTPEQPKETKENRDTIVHSESFCSARDATSIKQGDHHFKCITRGNHNGFAEANNHHHSLRQWKIEEKCARHKTIRQ